MNALEKVFNKRANFDPSIRAHTEPKHRSSPKSWNVDTWCIKKNCHHVMFHVHDQPVSIYFPLPHVWVDVFMSMIDAVQRQSLHTKYDLWISWKAKCGFLVKMLQKSHKLTKAMLKKTAASHCLTTPGGAFGLSAWHWLRQRSSFDVQALPELCRKPHPLPRGESKIEKKMENQKLIKQSPWSSTRMKGTWSLVKPEWCFTTSFAS